MSALSGMTPIVYQDVMRVAVAGTLGKPHIGVNRIGESEPALVLTIDEARELQKALAWALAEYDARMGHQSFYPN